jgi:hypothetical protein
MGSRGTDEGRPGRAVPRGRGAALARQRGAGRLAAGTAAGGGQGLVDVAKDAEHWAHVLTVRFGEAWTIRDDVIPRLAWVGSGDMVTVCDLAGISPEATMAYVERELQRERPFAALRSATRGSAA